MICLTCTSALAHSLGSRLANFANGEICLEGFTTGLDVDDARDITVYGNGLFEAAANVTNW